MRTAPLPESHVRVSLVPSKSGVMYQDEGRIRFIVCGEPRGWFILQITHPFVDEPRFSRVTRSDEVGMRIPAKIRRILSKRERSFLRNLRKKYGVAEEG